MNAKPKRAEKERLGKVTVEKKDGLIIYHVKVNPPKPRRLTVKSCPQKR